MITLKQILPQICPGDWFMSLDLKVLLHPGTFTRCMDAALSPLRQMGIRILNYLDDWLILAQSQAILTSYKTLLLSHLDCLGLRVNFAKSTLSPSQRVLFLGTVIELSADDNNCLSGASHDNLAQPALLQGRYSLSAQSFPENAGPYGSSFAGTSVGSASHVIHPVLTEAEGSIRSLASTNATA